MNIYPVLVRVSSAWSWRAALLALAAVTTAPQGHAAAGRAGAALPAIPAGGVVIPTPPHADPTKPAAPVALHWLDGTPPPVTTGVSWGVPWPEGAVQKSQTFTLTGNNGAALPLQTWPLAYWPDGSIKWSGFATVGNPATAGEFKLAQGSAPATTGPLVKATTYATCIDIDTGASVTRVPLTGSNITDFMTIGGRMVVGPGQLVCILQDQPDTNPEDSPHRERYVSSVKKVTLEQSGPVRAVVKIEGVHKGVTSGREWLPFVVRLYFYAGESDVRIVHTIFFDGDQSKDFIRGLGVTYSVPFAEEVQNRHVRFASENGGLWSEPIQPLIGRDGPSRIVTWPNGGGDVYPTQLQGERIPNAADVNAQGQRILRMLASWSDFKLSQLSADGFTIVKRTNPQSTWLDAGAGKRAAGYAFVGDVSGGLGVSIKNFWQSYPAELEIKNATSAAAQFNAWLWSPEAVAMDLRHYDIRAHGLEESYEDVQEGLSTPYGVARTSELKLFVSGGIPPKEASLKMAQAGTETSLLVCTPQYYHDVGAFGVWSVQDRSTPFKAAVENHLDSVINYYLTQPEERNWYGFWHFGNVMHSYDNARHVWRYDLGGMAWDNSELGTDSWLWYTFLRTGRPDVFRMAEAMSRHTGEVNAYHFGPMAGLGTRHGVIEWGDGAKEARIAQAPYRRFYYYLTADERTGDVMHEMLQADQSVVQFDPLREADPPRPTDPKFITRVRVGPDWFALAGNWMTEWERTGDTKWRDRIIVGMKSIEQMSHGLRTGRGMAMGFDPVTAALYPRDDSVGSGNLATIMGGAEVMAELNRLIDDPAWQKLYADFAADHGGSISTGRMLAYAAAFYKDPALAQRAIDSVSAGGGRNVRPVAGEDSLNPVTEGAAGTNGAAQGSLNDIEVLEWVKDQLPTEAPAGGGRGGRGRGGATAGNAAAVPIPGAE